MYMYAGLTETTKLNALYYFRRGKKGWGISLATPCGLGELMLGIVLGDVKFLKY